MGLIRKAASILTLGGVGNHGRRDPQAKAAKGQAALAEAETEMAEEQTAVIANALHEDEAHRQADLEEVAENEAEASVRRAGWLACTSGRIPEVAR